MNKRFLLSLMAAACLSCLSIVNAQNVQNDGDLHTRQQKRMIKKIQASSDIQIFADNSQGSGLYIQEASVKEIAADDFRLLTGEQSGTSRRSTFPAVILVNGSGKTITGFAIAVQSADEGKAWHFLLPHNLSLAPNSSYTIPPSQWPVPERVSVQMEGKFVNRVREPGLESAKSWMRGTASNLRITIAAIDFEDGTKWKVSPDYQ